MKKLIMATVAATMLSTAANAVLFKDGKTASLADLNKHYIEQGWTHAPKAKGYFVPGHIGGKFLNEGTILPTVGDPLALKRALNLKDKPILVASKYGVMPCSPFMSELAKQNGISCEDMVKYFYLNTPAEMDDMGNEITKSVESFKANIQSYTQEITNVALEKEFITLPPQIIEIEDPALRAQLTAALSTIDTLQLALDTILEGIRENAEEFADNRDAAYSTDIVSRSEGQPYTNPYTGTQQTDVSYSWDPKIGAERTYTFSKELSVGIYLNHIENAIEQAYDDGYRDGYSDGYADGYADGFADGVASVQ